MNVTKLWWLSLAIFTAVVGVVAALLGLVIQAARSIDRHAADIWTVGKQIAGNTVSIWLLGRTNDQVRRMADTTRSLEQAVSSMDEKLRPLADAASRKD